MFLTLLLVSISIARYAGADPAESQPDSGAQAIELGRAGLEAYQKATWEVAHAQFAEAERLVHSPVFVLYMARCKRNLGHLLGARELYRAAAQEHLPPDAPAPWSQAVASAHAELGMLQQNIPSLWIRLRSDSNVVRVTVDSRDVAPSANGGEVELDPGEHMVEIWRADGSRERRAVQLREGRRRVPIWVPKPSVSAALPGTFPPGGRRERPRALSRDQIVGYTAIGVGTVGMVTGVLTGLIAVARTNSAKDAYCDERGDCYPAARSRVEAASDWAAVSTVGFIFGTSALAAGTAVLLVAPISTGSQARLVLQGAL